MASRNMKKAESNFLVTQTQEKRREDYTKTTKKGT